MLKLCATSTRNLRSLLETRQGKTLTMMVSFAPATDDRHYPKPAPPSAIYSIVNYGMNMCLMVLPLLGWLMNYSYRGIMSQKLPLLVTWLLLFYHALSLRPTNTAHVVVNTLTSPRPKARRVWDPGITCQDAIGGTVLVAPSSISLVSHYIVETPCVGIESINSAGCCATVTRSVRAKSLLSVTQRSHRRGIIECGSLRLFLWRRVIDFEFECSYCYPV